MTEHGFIEPIAADLPLTGFAMAIDPTAFERFRRSPNEKTTLPRLVLGSIIAAVFWFATTIAVIFGGEKAFGPGDTVQQFLSTAGGLLATLATFAGIWLGVWIAMRALHREKLSRLFGNSARISRSGFLKGLAAVLITSVLTELGFWLMIPDVERGPIELRYMGCSICCPCSSSPSCRPLRRNFYFAVICSVA